MNYIIVKDEHSYREYPITKNLTIGNLLFNKKDDELFVQKEDEAHVVVPFIWNEDMYKYMYMEDRETTYEIGQTLTISGNVGDIVIEDLPYNILIKDNTMYVEKAVDRARNVNIYINKQILNEFEASINPGDVILIDTYKITYFGKEIVITGAEDKIVNKLLKIHPKNKYFEGFPRYKRSPRIIKKINEEAISINNPPGKSSMPKGSIVQLIVPTLCMLCITVAISILMNRGIFVLISICGTVMSLITSISKYVSDKKRCKEQDAARTDIYEKYLLNMRKRISRRRNEEIDAWNYNNPSIEDISSMINEYSSRIYERNCNDDDFINVCIGHKEAKTSFDIKVNYDDLSLDKDDLLTEAQDIKKQMMYIDKKPIIVDLKKAHMGLVGEKVNVHEQLKLLVSQLTFMQSYHDLEIIAIYDEKYNEDFKWMRWYPHFRIKEINAIGCINSERMRDQILGSIHQIIKDRKLKRDESKKEGRFLPHYIFIIDEPKIIMDHSIMEYLDKEGFELGFSIIYTSQLRANLPENIGTVLILNNSTEGVLLLNEKEMVNTKLQLNRIGDIDLEKMSRNLSLLQHEQGIVSQIPESITFFDMYQIEKPEQLKIAERWSKNESHKSLAVPLGVRAPEDYVYLNLHEKAHGPHGLVAGTTGSGKSEIVQSYILSLAVNFHPDEVGFLLIDYKGGGMAGLFKDLPHLLGTITNLDGSESYRAMVSIKSELARRQRIFNENNVNHINAYNKLYKSGKVQEAIPHLFLISDEFAELKKEQPEFMTELVSAARIGRSLGVHLILATQKPSGVVDDQIWTNSKFKLALKVQNEADSKEILKTPDAAFITQAGRAYLQVGNNEIYELFQSAWSGATYVDEKEEEVTDDRVYLVNELGQGELVNQDLSRTKESNQIKDTQLDVVVKHINDVFQAKHLKKVKSPWLPSLGTQIVSPYIDIEAIVDSNLCSELDMKANIGLIDIPEQQKQEEYVLDFVEDGNLAIFGASGFGKTTVLVTMMISLALKNSASNLIYYIIDLGNAGLIQLKGLPNTADYITFDDGEKLNKLINIMDDMIKTRKRLFAKVNAMNFDMYNRKAEDRLPAVMIYIDNYDVIKEVNPDIESFITQITRDGVGLGIYVVLTATRPGVVRYSIMNNFKNKLSLYMFEKSDMNTVVGRTEYPIGEIKGRGLVKLENVNQVQMYVATTFKKAMDYTDSIGDIVNKISSSYTGERAKSIPMLPEELTIEVFKEFVEDTQDKYMIPIGLDTENVEVQYMDITKSRQIIVGGSQTGKTNLLKVLLNTVSTDVKVYLIDSMAAELVEYDAQENITYINNAEALINLQTDLEQMIMEREEMYEEEKEIAGNIVPRLFYSKLTPVLIIIEEFDTLVDMIKADKLTGLEGLLMKAELYNISIVATASKMKGYDALSKYMKESISGIILGFPGEQNIYTVPHMKQVNIPTGIGYIYNKGELIKIKTPMN